jgi:hypothetical protein
MDKKIVKMFQKESNKVTVSESLNLEVEILRKVFKKKTRKDQIRKNVSVTRDPLKRTNSMTQSTDVKMQRRPAGDSIGLDNKEVKPGLRDGDILLVNANANDPEAERNLNIQAVEYAQKRNFNHGKIPKDQIRKNVSIPKDQNKENVSVSESLNLDVEILRKVTNMKNVSRDLLKRTNSMTQSTDVKIPKGQKRKNASVSRDPLKRTNSMTQSTDVKTRKVPNKNGVRNQVKKIQKIVRATRFPSPEPKKIEIDVLEDMTEMLWQDRKNAKIEFGSRTNKMLDLKAEQQ